MTLAAALLSSAALPSSAALLSSAALAAAPPAAPPMDGPPPPPVTEEDFHDVIESIAGLYAPEAALRGKTLAISPLWELEDRESSSWQEGDLWDVRVMGGTARHPLATRDALALAVCHEIGHFLGGFPRYHPFEVPEDSPWTWDPATPSPWAWSSAEGQADYFAASKCLRRHFANDDNAALMEGVRAPAFASELCARSFAEREDAAVCARGMMAALAYIRLATGLPARPPLPVPLDQDAPTTRERSYLEHPAPGCRLETLLRGVLCGKSPEEPFSDTDYRKGACTREGGSGVGARPSCWFSPGPDGP